MHANEDMLMNEAAVEASVASKIAALKGVDSQAQLLHGGKGKGKGKDSVQNTAESSETAAVAPSGKSGKGGVQQTAAAASGKGSNGGKSGKGSKSGTEVEATAAPPEGSPPPSPVPKPIDSPHKAGQGGVQVDAGSLKEAVRVKAKLAKVKMAAMNLKHQIDNSDEWAWARGAECLGLLAQALRHLEENMSKFHQEYLVVDFKLILGEYSAETIKSEIETFVKLCDSIGKIKDATDMLVNMHAMRHKTRSSK